MTGAFLKVGLAALLWALSGTAAKYLFLRGTTPFDLVQIRTTLSALILLTVMALFRRRQMRVGARELVYFALLGVLGLGMTQFTYFLAISKIKVAVAIFLEFTAPIFIALYCVLFRKEHLSLAMWIAILSAVVGCYFVVGAYQTNFLSLNHKGLVAGLSAAVAFGGYSIMADYGLRRHPPDIVLGYALGFAAVSWHFFHPPLASFSRSWTREELLAVAYIVGLGTVVPFWLYFDGIRTIGATAASLTATLEPVAAAVFAFFWVGESMEGIQMAGGILVVASLGALQRLRRLSARKRQNPLNFLDADLAPDT